MISEKGDKEELIMTMENIINYTCCTIIKMSEHSKGRFTFMRTQSRSTRRIRSWGSPTRPWRTLATTLVAPFSKHQNSGRKYLYLLYLALKEGLIGMKTM